MGGTNWLRDDGTVNGECHFYKVDTGSPVYYARFKTLTWGGKREVGSYEHTPHPRGLITRGSFIICCSLT